MEVTHQRWDEVSSAVSSEHLMRMEERWMLLKRAGYVVAAAAVVGFILGVLGSDMFAIRTVYVLCENPSLQEEAAERARQLHFSSIWLPPTRAIERRIGGLPRARAVTIDRELPSTLVIKVEPRRPAAVVVADERYMAIDEEGMCLHWTGSPSSTLPTIHLDAPWSLRVGRMLPKDDVKRIQELLRALVPEGLAAGASIDLTNPFRISIFTADGVLGKLGSDDLLYEKALLFGELLEALRKEGREPLYIDLRVPSRPTYRPVDAG